VLGEKLGVEILVELVMVSAVGEEHDRDGFDAAD